MPEHINNLNLAQNIQDALVKLQNGESSINHLEDMVVQARELYERLLVLRFKAYELKVRPEKMLYSNEKLITDSIDTSLPSEKIEEIIPKEDDTPFDFSLFGEVEKQTESTTSSAEETDIFVPSEASIGPKIDEVHIEAPESNASATSKTQTSAASLLDKLSNNGSSERLGDKLKNTKLESITSAFTLNDRIRFTKNLFDNNGDTFNAAIQLLDAQKGIIEARDLVQDYASRYEWDMEDKNSVDFIELIERRYA